MFIKEFKLFFDAPDTDKPASVIPSSDDKDSVIKFLGEDDEDKDEVIPLESKKEKPEKEIEDVTDEDEEDKKDEDGKEKDEKEDEEVDELKELEEELEEPDDEKLELTTPIPRREILKKYPNLFKDFPYLEKAYYRNYQYTELLPTIDDAKEAVEKSGVLDKIEADISDGNLERILLATKSQKAFNKVVDDYLPLLAKVDQAAYHHVVGNVIKHTISSMIKEGRTSQNEALQSAAAILNQFVFGTSDFVPPEKLSKETKTDTTEEDKLKFERQQFFQERYESVNNEVNTKVNNSLKATIAANIDPRNSMTDYVKKNASREAFESLENLISKDRNFQVLVDKLWEKAAENKFSKEYTDRIRSAFFSKARTLLPAVIKQARNEALKGMGKRVREEKGDDSTKKESTTKEESPRSKTPSGKIPSGMSSYEYLMQD